MSGTEFSLSVLPDRAELTRRYGLGSSRRKNLGTILGVLQRSGPRSRADLVAETGLNKAIVAAAVGDLVDWHLVVEHDVTHTGQSGRPSRPVAISGPWVHSLGIEIRSDRVVSLITDLGGEVRASGDMPFPTRRDVSELTAEEIDGVLARVVIGLIEETYSQQGALAGICLSIPGQLQRRREASANDPYEWNVVDAVERLQKLLSDNYGIVPEVAVERSVDVAVLAEQRLGMIQPDVDLIMISGDVAMSAGLVLDGRPLRRSSGLLGDIGHLVVDPGGARCRCGGRGCWETVVGVEAVLRECAPDLAGDPRRPALPSEVQLVVGRALRGELRAVEGLERIGYWLGVGISSLVSVLGPNLVVLDGYFRAIAPWTNDEMRATIASHVTGPAFQELTIDVSWLDDSASTLGASVLAAAHVVADPVSLVIAATQNGTDST